ncbi:MAG: cell surface protein SprA, partial [Candidatus Marinimicrobia bacterium]|nr:cell surface protein SprA [Candidatus Neomarinimicrobiota bacterium]
GSATGAAYDSIGSVGFVKTGGDDRIVLKLIKDRGQSASSPTWQLEFKNVYSLGGININPEGFDVKIFDIQATGGRTDRLGNETFLKIFGLDQRSNSDQQGPPDDLVDTYNFAIVKLALGELHFPSLLPFAYSSVPGLATSDTVILEVYDKELEDLNGNFVFEDGEDLNNDGKWDVPDLYYAPLRPISARFEIEVQQSSAGKSIYNLGFNMVPGSETVKINGQTLVEGKDYEIDMFSNTLTILRMEDYVNPDVVIEYEENSLVSFDKKVMMGIRAQMDLGESSFLGITGLYYNQSIIDERVDVGSEPIRNMLWDVNGRLRRDAPMLTRLIDRLPFIETDAASSFNIEGEIAQVLPNPNPLGTGYVDDFEAAKRVSSPSLQYRSWKQSSPPVGKRLHQRRKMAWWNPFQDKSVQDIWPQRETSIRANNLTTTILILDAFFDRFNELPTDSMWAGITYPLFAGEYDQSQTKFFEVWLNGFQGRLHIDIGDISEDINGNGVIDTEDEKLPGTTEGNSLLDEGEDVGLDGCLDEFEDGTGGCFGIDDDRDGRTDEEIFNGIDDDGDGRIDEDLGARPALADINDPNGDNWKNSSSNRSNDFINGTEGNSQSADGSRPDTEDLNGTGSFAPDVKNDYFTVSFSLDPLHADTSFVGGSTFNENGSPTGWRLFRIPLSEFQPEGRSTVTWDNVKNLRLWVDKLGGASFDSRLTSQIQIAQIEFVGNEWEEIGIATIGSDIFSVVDSTLNLAVSVVNTEDNQDYSSPPKVDGVFDRLNGIRLREQSLSLDFSVIGLPPRTKGALSKEIVNRTNDATFLAYRTMEMFVYGDAQDVGEPLMTPELTYYQFWLRLGLGKASGESYYELRKSLYPGWDDRNHFDIDMVALAGLKIAEPDTMIVIDADSLPAYILDDDMLVIIRGDPSVDRIGRYTVGVTNIHPTRSIYGRAFIDELRLTGVEKEKGMAVRLSGSLNLADLMTTSFSYVRTDANFHNIQQKIARGPTTRETFRSNLLLNPHQLLPKSWGIRTPVSMNYTRSINSPKYLPGRDIRAGDLRSAPDSVQQRSETVAVKVSFGKSARSRFWVMRQTLDRLTGGVTYQVKDQSNKEILSLEEQSITTNLNYPIKFSDENYIKPFGIIGKIPWLGNKLKDTRIYYTPTSLQVSGTVSEVISNKVVRAQRDTTLERYNFNLKRS